MRKWQQQHWLAGVLLLLSLALGWTVLRPVTAFAAPTASSDFVKYYVVVSSYQGGPENLGEIATRFLGTAQRAQDIFELNSGRVQSDGGKLTDPDTLHKGWRLILPWDAVGSGVQYGALPSATPTPASPTPGSTPVGTPPGGSGPGPSQPANPDAAKCAGTSRSPNNPQDQWGTLRLAPDHAWTYTRGAGVTVAVVDSGVDASLPALSGRVTEGTDIVSGTGRGDTDCLGSGTVMASIVAARSDQGGGSVTGVAPDARILPVRLVTTNSRAGSADQVAAIQFAVSAGAKVIALGSYVTPSDPAVAAAIAQASSHDAVVVMAAPSDSAQPAPLASAASAPVLRVGGVGIDGTLTTKYATSSVDVVAPGKQVAGLGISGTGQVAASGTQYAVAFVAGQAALVRARFPGLTNEQVIRRIEATADRIGNSSPDPQFGWGLIDPGVSVTRVIPDEGRVAAPPAPVRGPGLAPGPRMAAIGIIAVVSLAAFILLMLRLRWIIRPSSASPPLATAVGEEPTPAKPVVKRIGSVPSPSTLDDMRSTAAEPTWTGSDGASSARGIPVPAGEQRTSVGLATSSAVPPDLGTGERGSGERA